MAHQQDKFPKKRFDETELVLQNMNDISQALKKLHHHQNCFLDIVEEEEQRGDKTARRK